MANLVKVRHSALLILNKRTEKKDMCPLNPWRSGQISGVVGLALALLLSPAVVSVDAQDSPCDIDKRQPWIVPDGRELDTSTDEVEWARHFWNSFVAVNWPQRSLEEGAQPGEPDPTRSICDPETREPVFLRWAQKEQMLPADPTQPYPSWEELSPPTYNGLPLIGTLGMNSNNELKQEFEEAMTDRPLYDQNGRFVLYQIFANKSEHTYMAQTAYYDSVNQYNAFKTDPPQFVVMPHTGDPEEFNPEVVLEDWARQGAIELKTSWKQLTEAEIESGRFLMQEVYYAQNRLESETPCGPVTIGMVGMHVLQLTKNTSDTWIWATFEQVDNVSVDSSHPTGTPSFNPGPASDCPPPYAQGYTCQTPEDPTAAECIPGCTMMPCPQECPPLAPTLESPLVCDAYPDRRVNVSRVPELAIPPYLQIINEEYQQQLPAPFRYYQLVGTLHPEEDGPCCVPPMQEGNQVSTCWLTNTTMETYTQYRMPSGMFMACDGGSPTTLSMNCTDCHAHAAPRGAPLFGEGPYAERPYQVFSFMFQRASSSCPADFNHDGIVNGLDLSLLLGAWGTDATEFELAGGNIVDGADLGILLAAWGTCPPPAGSTPLFVEDSDEDPLGKNGIAFKGYLEHIGARSPMN